MAGRVSATPQSILDSMKRCELERAYGMFPICVAYLMLLPEIKEVFRDKYGDAVLATNFKPYVLSSYDSEMKEAQA